MARILAPSDPNEILARDLDPCVVASAAPQLLSACMFALATLQNLTSEDFARGEDRAARDCLRHAIRLAGVRLDN